MLELLGRGEGPDEARLGERIAAGPDVVRHPGEGRREVLPARGGHRDAFVDEAEEVGAHPGHAGELRPVGELVDGDPEAELARREPVPALERDDVRADVVDEVARVVGVLGEQQVVLAEDPGGHPAEDDAELGAGGSPHGGRHRRRHLRAQEPVFGRLGEDRPEKAPERADVRPDPAVPVGDLGTGRPGKGGEPGRGLDERLGDGRQLGEVVDEPSPRALVHFWGGPAGDS